MYFPRIKYERKDNPLVSEKSMVAQENVGDLQFSVDAVDELIYILKGVIERKHI